MVILQVLHKVNCYRELLLAVRTVVPILYIVPVSKMSSVAVRILNLQLTVSTSVHVVFVQILHLSNLCFLLESLANQHTWLIIPRSIFRVQIIRLDLMVTLLLSLNRCFFRLLYALPLFGLSFLLLRLLGLVFLIRLRSET
jgi:hypothetical protein